MHHFKIARSGRGATLGLALAALGACSPLQQAPLVYSSKSSFGLDLSATSTETPGISLNLGSKQVDSAYVPVVVALPCRGGLNQDMTACQGEQFKMMRVFGTSTQTNDSSPTALRLKAAEEDRDRAAAAVGEKSRALDAAKSKADLDQVLAGRLADKRDAQNALPADSAPEIVRQAQSQVQEASDAASRAASNMALVDKLKAELPVAQAELDRKLRAYEAALAENAIKNGMVRDDALSVFGTFDGKADGKGDVNADKAKVSASLSIGKMFSTGVASQVLAGSMSSVYGATCLEKARQAVEVIQATNATADQKTAVTLAIYTACQRTEGAGSPRS